MTTLDGNGTGVEPLEGSSTELAALEAAYREIQRRDGTAERRAWHWQCTAWLAIVGLMGLGIYDHVDKRSVPQPFVQTVVQQEDGRLVSLGVPVDLLAYEPQDGTWFEFVGEWIRRIRWRGKDVVLAQADMTWLQYHTCGMEARRVLSEEQRGWKPEHVGKVLAMVELKSVTKTPSPLSYQVLWKETTIPKAMPPEEKMYSATLTTGRTMPTGQEHLMSNRLGLCITAWNISVQP